MTSRVAFTLLFALSATAPAYASGLWGSDDLDVFDGKWTLGDGHSLVTELQGKGDESTASRSHFQQEQRFGGDALSVRYAFAAGKWYAKANYGRTDDAIRAGPDFARQVGEDRTEVVVGRHWNGSGRHWWKKRTVRTTYEQRETNDGKRLADRYSAEFGFVGDKLTSLQLKYFSGREFQAGQLFDFDRFVVSGRVKPHADMEVGLDTDIGERLDYANTRLAEQQRVDPFLSWKLSKKLRLYLSGTHVDLDTREGQWILDANMLDAQLTWQFHDRGSFSVMVQQQDILRNQDAYLQTVESHTHEVGHELMYSWQVNPQTEISVGFSDAYADNVEFSALAEPNRNWFMRLGYALAL